jgi:hypothetical protein
VTLASHPPGESPKSANARDLLQNMSLNRVEDFFIADVGSGFKLDHYQRSELALALMNAKGLDLADAVLVKAIGHRVHSFAADAGTTGPSAPGG